MFEIGLPSLVGAFSIVGEWYDIASHVSRVAAHLVLVLQLKKLGFSIN